MSYGLYIGKNHTRDGIAYLGGYGDEPSSHWLEMVPSADFQEGATVRVGVTPQADLPGQLSEIPQILHTARHIRVSYSYYKGVPAPLCNGGLNEYGVAVRDIWSTSRKELIAMTPADQTGPNYSDLAKLVLERAHTAREGVELISKLISQYGESSYGGNSHIIADPEEAWVVIQFAGGHRLWVAERLNSNSIRASRPGYIGTIPHRPDETYLFPSHFIPFAIQQGWYDPATGPFDVNCVYGDGKGHWAGAAWIETEMQQRSARPEKIGLTDMMWAIRTPRLTGDTAGYGQIVPLVHSTCTETRMVWHAPIGALAAPFMPVFLGMTEIAAEYLQHRYLTAGEDSRFMDERHALNGNPNALSHIPQGIEASRSAVQVFKRLLYLALREPVQFLPELEQVWSAHEHRLERSNTQIQRAAEVLFSQNETVLASAVLTYFANTELLTGLLLGEQMVLGLEARVKTLRGFDTALKPSAFPQIW